MAWQRRFVASQWLPTFSLPLRDFLSISLNSEMKPSIQVYMHKDIHTLIIFILDGIQKPLNIEWQKPFRKTYSYMYEWKSEEEGTITRINANDRKWFANNKWKCEIEKSCRTCWHSNVFSMANSYAFRRSLCTCMSVCVLKLSNWRIVKQSNCHMINNTFASLFKRCLRVILWLFSTTWNNNKSNAQWHLCLDIADGKRIYILWLCRSEQPTAAAAAAVLASFLSLFCH